MRIDEALLFRTLANDKVHEHKAAMPFRAKHAVAVPYAAMSDERSRRTFRESLCSKIKQ